tara:strand:+ start:1964 stop:2146 length:183 start_codon:yes stop_codon:yes gene_type:complete
LKEKIEKIIKKMEKQKALTKKLYNMIENAKVIKLSNKVTGPVWYKLLKVDKGDIDGRSNK